MNEKGKEGGNEAVEFKWNIYYCHECGGIAFVTKNEETSLRAEQILCLSCAEETGKLQKAEAYFEEM